MGYDPRLLAALAQHAAQARQQGLSLAPMQAQMPQLDMSQIGQVAHRQTTAGQYNQPPQGMAPHPPPYEAPGYSQAQQLAQHQAAVTYAKQRLDQMRRIASSVGIDFQNELGQATAPHDGAAADPAAAWREVSAALAKAALAAGYRDPRVFIQDMLARSGGVGPHGHQAA